MNREDQIRAECLRMAVGARDAYPGTDVVDVAEKFYNFMMAVKPQAGE